MQGANPTSCRGVTAVETAIIIPLALALIFGVIEAGFFTYTRLTIDDVAAAGARRAAIAVTAEDADLQVLREISDHAGIVRRAKVERIVVYRPEGAADGPPPSCRSGVLGDRPADHCTAYGPAELIGEASPGACSWCADNADPDLLLGVWVKLRYDSLTGFFPVSDMSDSTVLRIEPGL